MSVLPGNDCSSSNVILKSNSKMRYYRKTTI